MTTAAKQLTPTIGAEVGDVDIVRALDDQPDRAETCHLAACDDRTGMQWAEPVEVFGWPRRDCAGATS